MAAKHPSRLGLDKEALNALFERLVNRPGEFEAWFDEGRILLRLKETDLAIEDIVFHENGLDIRLRLT